MASANGTALGLTTTLIRDFFPCVVEVNYVRDQTMILRSGQDGIIAHTLFNDDEVKRESAFRADSNLVSTKEMALDQYIHRKPLRHMAYHVHSAEPQWAQ
ncbi:MAG: hypothetical protein JWO80_3359 [Bryobacterales bacterium]|nr:hypothetical protein [Bryobacterales bacterium]